MRYESKVYSQNGEDGIIAEIFKRIDTTNRRFVEIGVSNGLECNTLSLLLNNWSGLWIEGSSKDVFFIKKNFHQPIQQSSLRIQEHFVDRENINTILMETQFTGEIDLLSLDIDGNDYHVIERLSCLDPRVIILEYNARFRPPIKWVMAYNPAHKWDGTDYFGASLKSYEDLMSQKGYSLVGCNLLGTNAFFVRNDLVHSDRFLSPFTAETHYQPARYELAGDMLPAGHPASFGSYLSEFLPTEIS